MFNKILLCSRNPKFKEEIQKLIGDLGYSLRQVESGSDIFNIENNYRPGVVIIEASDNRADLFQAHDAAYRKFDNTRVMVVYNNQLAFDFDQLGGRKQAMKFLQRPFEDELILNFLLEYAPIEIPAKSLKLEHLTPIRLTDIRPSDKFNFDLYLYMPRNKKILLYRRKNSVLTVKQIESFEKFHIYDLYVRKNEMHVVTDYLAKKLSKSFADKTLSATERRRKIQNEVREVFGKFFDTSSFDYSKSRVTLETCKQVVGKFITEINPKSDVYAQLLHYTAQGSSQYNHAINVSVFAVLFALALEVPDIEGISIGALLHDIGVATLPPGLAHKDQDMMTPDEKKLYQTHTTSGLKLIEGKKILASEVVKSIISQHHENMDGSGYPAALKKDQINACARIVQIANTLDKLTCIKPNQVPLSPLNALDKMAEENKISEIYDSGFLAKLREVLAPPNQAQINLETVSQTFSEPVDMPPNPESMDFNDTKRQRRRKKLA